MLRVRLIKNIINIITKSSGYKNPVGSTWLATVRSSYTTTSVPNRQIEFPA